MVFSCMSAKSSNKCTGMSKPRHTTYAQVLDVGKGPIPGRRADVGAGQVQDVVSSVDAVGQRAAERTEVLVHARCPPIVQCAALPAKEANCQARRMGSLVGCLCNPCHRHLIIRKHNTEFVVPGQQAQAIWPSLPGREPMGTRYRCERAPDRPLRVAVTSTLRQAQVVV